MQAVVDYLAENRSRFIEELSQYIRFPSVAAQSNHRQDMEVCARWLTEHCQGIGFDATLLPSAGQPIVLARSPRRRGTRKPQVLVYGHYDVQPPEPLDLWHSPPFEPRIDGQSLFGRGATDNKGPLWSHIKAAEAYLRTNTELPCDLTFLIEGEEEIGSPSLPAFLKQHRRQLQCDVAVISDNDIPGRDFPSLTCGLRGCLALDVRLDGPARDLHSGMFGGIVDNPVTVLCQMLGRLHDLRGRVTVPGFYESVARLSREERRQLARHPATERAKRQEIGVPALGGEQGFSWVERVTARPTLEINGITGGYQGEGVKTIIPSWASAKITCRLVQHQRPATIRRLLIQHLKRLCPRTVRLTLTSKGPGGAPYLLDPAGPHAQAALRALRLGFKREPLLTRSGGSIPIVEAFRKLLGVDTLLLGLSLPDDNLHAPNEKFDLGLFADGMNTSAHLWAELARQF